MVDTSNEWAHDQFVVRIKHTLSCCLCGETDFLYNRASHFPSEEKEHEL